MTINIVKHFLSLYVIASNDGHQSSLPDRVVFSITYDLTNRFDRKAWVGDVEVCEAGEGRIFTKCLKINFDKQLTNQSDVQNVYFKLSCSVVLLHQIHGLWRVA